VTREMRRIAVEEAFSIPEVAAAFKQVVRGPGDSSDLGLLRGSDGNRRGDSP
jgi:hypothetical protein